MPRPGSKRIHCALLAALAALAALPARAKVYTEWRPRASIYAGYDDNVPLDGSGGDYFGQVRPGLKFDLYGDHHLRLDLDCQAGVGKLANPEKFGIEQGAFATSEQCIGTFKDTLSTRTTMHVFARGIYARDPFDISGLGLLLRVGQTQVFSSRLTLGVDHAVSPRGQWNFAFDWQTLAFTRGDAGNGMLLTPAAGYTYRTSPYASILFTGREQLFYSFGAPPQPAAPQGIERGLLTQGHAGLLGWAYRITEVTTVTGFAGPLYVTGKGGDLWMPVGHLEIEGVTPHAGVHVTLFHDLVIGATRAGPLVGDLAEIGLMGALGRFTAHLRAGIYRNVDVAQQYHSLGSIGFSGEGEVDLRIAKEWSIGVAALRDARLNDVNVGQQVDRNVVQVRLTWSRAQPL
jgi:hypothetical protein